MIQVNMGLPMFLPCQAGSMGKREYTAKIAQIRENVTPGPFGLALERQGTFRP